MTVLELKKALYYMPDELEVMLPDHQGLAMKVDGIATEFIVEKDGRDYKLFDSTWSADDACETEEKWEKLKKTPRICLIDY